MIITVTENIFIDSFKQSDSRKEQFSYSALENLFDYYESCEDPTCPVELDVVEICCKWTEYDSIEEFLRDYDLNVKNEVLTELESNDYNILKDKIIELLNEKTTVIECDSTFLVMNF